MTKQHFDTDVLIIGSGLAGLRAGVQALHRQVDAIMISAGPIGLESSSLTPMAVNHLATDWLDVPMSAGDREKLVIDILKAGLGHAHEPSARVLAKHAHQEYTSLLSQGIQFATSMGVLVRQRGCFAGRIRTLVMEQIRELRTLFWRQLKVHNIHLMDHVMATRLFVQNGRFVGAAGVNRSGETVTIRASSCVLASGGSASVYSRSIVPPSLIGASYVLAHEAGLPVRNLHFVEFVIALIDVLPKVQKFKFMGTLRLRDSKGADILEGVYPSFKELEKANDQRAEHYPFTMHDGTGLIDIAIARASERGGCSLVSHTGAAPITIYARNSNGGVVTDETTATGVEGLFACGEAATGAHGALRVGGTYLDEALVFGGIAGKAAVDHARKAKPADADLRVEEKIDPSGGLQEGELQNYRTMVREIMTSKMLVAREIEEMKAARKVAETALSVVTSKGCREPSQLWAWHETRIIAACARLMIDHALAMPESLGPHYVIKRP